MLDLTIVKAALRVTHNSDDDEIERLIASATREYLEFSGEDEISSDMFEGRETVATGVILMVQADYDADPLDREKYRDAAKHLWGKHRLDFGL